MAFDLLIKDGILIDGTGKPRERADVAISDGLIQAVGSPAIAGASAEKTISASGKFVAPGFIDLTSHADASGALFLNPAQDYLTTQGITTILVGNCGSSLAPLASPEAAHGLRKWAEAGRNINWLSVGEFLRELAKQPLGVNVGTLVGHGTVRRGILRGAIRSMTLEELTQASALIGHGLAEGAFGLSAGLVYAHESPASVEELVMLGRPVAAAGGVFKLHLRNEGQNIVPAVNEAVRISREAKCRVVIAHLKAIGRKAWPHFASALGIVERARADGAEIAFDVSPYQRTGSFLYLLLPAWAREGGFDPMLARLRDAKGRPQVIEDLRSLTLHFERYIVASALDPGMNGRTIADIADRAGTPPEEAMLDLLLANRGRVTVFGRTLSSRNLASAIRHPLGAVASDASGVSPELERSGRLTHPRSTGAFPHFLHSFVREKGLVTWEEGIRKITSSPAQLLGLTDRGRIAPSLHADIVIFNPDQIRDRSTYQNPYVHSTGIETVIVNGQIAIADGKLTGVTAGQVLKKS